MKPEPEAEKGKVFAIDFETYYGKELSIDTHGLYHYLRDPAASIYLVSIYSPESDGEFAYVGKPEDFDWQMLDGSTLCAHNARFDRACFERLRELGIVPAVNYENEKGEILCHATWGRAHCRPSPHPFLLGSWALSETFYLCVVFFG